MTSQVEDPVFRLLDGMVPPCDSPVHKDEKHDPIPPAQWVIFWAKQLPCGIKPVPISLQCHPCYLEVVSGEPFVCGPRANPHSHNYSVIVRRIEPL